MIKKEIPPEALSLKPESGASSMKSQSVTSSPLLLPTPPCEELEVIEKQIKQDNAVQHKSDDFSLLNNDNNSIQSPTLLNDNHHYHPITTLKNGENENQVTKEAEHVKELVTNNKKEEEMKKVEQVVINDKKEDQGTREDQDQVVTLKVTVNDDDKDESSTDDQTTRESSVASIALSNVPTIITSVENVKHDNKKDDIIDHPIKKENDVTTNHDDNEQPNKEEKLYINNITTNDNANSLPKLDKSEDHHLMRSSPNKEVLKVDEKNSMPKERNNNDIVESVKVQQINGLNLENNEPKIDEEKDNSLKEDAIKKENDAQLTIGSTLENHPQKFNSVSTISSNSRFLQHAPIQKQEQEQYPSFPSPPPIPTVSTNTKIDHHRSSSSLRTNITSSTSTSSSLSKKIQSKLKSPGRKLTKLFKKKDKEKK